MSIYSSTKKIAAPAFLPRVLCFLPLLASSLPGFAGEPTEPASQPLNQTPASGNKRAAETEQAAQAIQPVKSKSKASGTLVPNPLMFATRAFFVAPDSKDSVFKTSFGRVQVKSGSVVYATDSFRGLNIYNLNSGNDAVKILLSDAQPFEIKSGQELFLTKSNGTFAKLKPYDAILSTNPKAINAPNGINGFIADFHVGSAVAVVPELRKKLNSSAPEDQKLLSRLLKISPQLIALTSKGTSETKASSVAPLPLTNFEENLIVYDSQEKNVPTSFGTITCAPGSVVYAVQTNKSCAIFVLDERKRGDVAVQIGQKRIAIRPAQELVLTRQSNSEFNEVNPQTHILFRAAKAEGVVEDVGIYRAEFMIERAVKQISGLRKLSESDNPEDVKSLRRILKNAAILQPTAKLELQDFDRIASIRGSGLEIFEPSTLQGKVEISEAAKFDATEIDLTLARSETAEPDADIRWLKETDNDWRSAPKASLESGQVAAILNCTKELVAKTETSRIHCKNGAIVFIANRDAYETVCNLECKSPKDVMIDLASGESIRLPIGYALVLHKQGQNLKAPGPAHLLTYRCWTEKKRSGNVEFMGAEFSLANAMYVLEPLREMVSSSNHKEQSQARSIMKSALILSQIAPGINYQRP